MVDRQVAPSRAVHRLVRMTFERIEVHGIACALLSGLDEAASPRGDVEVLVDPSSAPEIDVVLGDGGFVRMPAHGRGSHRFYVTYHADTDVWVKFDVVTEVEFGPYQEYRTPLAAVLLERARRVGRIPILDDADRFWHMLLRDLLGRGDVATCRRDVLRWLGAEADEAAPLAELVDGLRPGLASRLHAGVRDGDWEAVRDLARELRLAWRRQHRLTPVACAAARRVARSVPTPRTRRHGFSVAILGPDGAGKTTLADALRASVPVPSQYVYLGIWRQARFEQAFRHVFGAQLALRLVKLLAKSLVIGYYRGLGRLVLLDRYTYDAELPTSTADVWGRISARLVRMTCAAPGLTLLLDAPVELMYARKGEHGLAELQLRRDAYLEMRGRLPQMVVVDVAQTPDAVRRQATVLLWDKWSRRVRGGGPRSRVKRAVGRLSRHDDRRHAELTDQPAAVEARHRL
jgi:thymidylate kinase